MPALHYQSVQTIYNPGITFVKLSALLLTSTFQYAFCVGERFKGTRLRPKLLVLKNRDLRLSGVTPIVEEGILDSGCRDVAV